MSRAKILTLQAKDLADVQKLVFHPSGTLQSMPVVNDLLLTYHPAEGFPMLEFLITDLRPLEELAAACKEALSVKLPRHQRN